MPVTRPPVTQRGVYHIVGSGQTLWSISRAYGVDMDEIIRFNHIQDPARLGVGEELFIPGVCSVVVVEPGKKISLESVEKIVGSRHTSSKWRYITIHHSATLGGNAEAFDRNHRSRRMGGLFYHFVIGNGSASGDGEIEVGWRWRKQVKANRPYDIQICLVGDFTREDVSCAQMDSLVSLVKVLRRQYGISLKNIRRHKDIPGLITECPGNNFPFYRFLSELKK
ncbi:MAG: N-acetylmuramoyl-L-alanine amidase [Candidatus Omnitrophica bacterium]|nr:N-acetylmuramoyl-L-alanine amidase [Candidatus Omnitrophota bacterium]